MSTARPATIAAALFVCLGLCACHSPYVQTAIVNHTGGDVKLIEVDYPYASFGTQQLAENATFNYRFKILGSGPVKITFTGSDRQVHTATGPTLKLGQQGNLTMVLEGNEKVGWIPKLSPAK
jgi:hypothetical protein